MAMVVPGVRIRVWERGCEEFRRMEFWLTGLSTNSLGLTIAAELSLIEEGDKRALVHQVTFRTVRPDEFYVVVIL